MKRFRAALCLLLALICLFSLASPVFASESTAKGTATVKVTSGSKTLKTYTVTVGDEDVPLNDKRFITIDQKTYEFSHYYVSGKKYSSLSIPAYTDTREWRKDWEKTITVVYDSHTHKHKPGYNRIYHWSICYCGDTTNEVPHIDPAADEDKICTCGYKFNNNAELTTLWLNYMELSPRFKRETHDYIGNVATYRDVTSTSIVAKTFDAMSTVTLPENLEIHDGANKIEVLVTAEDKTTTSTYTVIAVKPVKVENTWIYADGTNVSVEVKTKVQKQIASGSVVEAITDKMLEMAANDGSAGILFQPKFSKWGTQALELILPGKLLKDIAEKTKAALLVKTPYDTTLTIPHDELAALAEGHETLMVRIGKDNSFALLDGETALTLPETVTLEVPQTK